MAPEQLFGKSVSARSDQFSFCVALYEALFHVRPYGGDGVLQIAERYRDGELQAPKAGLRVPGRIVAALQKGLSIESEKRFPSMAALLEALREPARVDLKRYGRLSLLVAGVAAVAWLGGRLSADAQEPSRASDLVVAADAEQDTAPEAPRWPRAPADDRSGQAEGHGAPPYLGAVRKRPVQVSPSP
jgi:hypothetical protein